jgi:hypothetical protein
MPTLPSFSIGFAVHTCLSKPLVPPCSVLAPSFFDSV